MSIDEVAQFTLHSLRQRYCFRNRVAAAAASDPIVLQNHDVCVTQQFPEIELFRLLPCQLSHDRSQFRGVRFSASFTYQSIASEEGPWSS